MSDFDLDKFRKEFLTSDGWKVSDVYKTYSDEFLRKDAQDAYEGAKWAWNHQQQKIGELESKLRAINEYQKIIYDQMQEHNLNYELIFNKLEDIEDLSR